MLWASFESPSPTKGASTRGTGGHSNFRPTGCVIYSVGKCTTGCHLCPTIVISGCHLKGLYTAAWKK